MNEKKSAIDTFKKINDNYTVTMCENGFVVEFGGEKENGDWVNAKCIFNTLEEVKSVVQDLSAMPRS